MVIKTETVGQKGTEKNGKRSGRDQGQGAGKSKLGGKWGGELDRGWWQERKLDSLQKLKKKNQRGKQGAGVEMLKTEEE